MSSHQTDTRRRGVPFTLRGKALWVLFYLVLGLGGSCLGLFLFIAGIPDSKTGLQALGAYCFLAGLGALAVAVALALTRRVPGFRENLVDGQPAVGLRAWPGFFVLHCFWCVCATMLGLALVLVGLSKGGDSVWVALALIPLIIWYGGKVVLVALGRRRLAAVWLTPTHIIHDEIAGRARFRRSDFREISVVTAGNGYLYLSGPVDPQGAPWPWSRADKLGPSFATDTSQMGVPAIVVAEWLESELARDKAAASQPNRASMIIKGDPDRVFDAFTDAEALAVWLPPFGTVGRIDYIDMRKGGSFRITLAIGETFGGAGLNSDDAHMFEVRIRELVASKLVIWEFDLGVVDRSVAGTIRAECRMRPVRRDTEVTVTTSGVPEQIGAEDQAEELWGILEQLAEWLEE